MTRFLHVLGALLMIVAFAESAKAQSIITVQELDFGLGIVKNNNAGHEVIVATGGGVSSDPDIVIINSPVNGIYRLVGAGAFQTIDSVNIIINQQMIGAGEDFVIGNFTTSFPATTDGSGEAIINVGARITTTATSNPYQDNTTFTSMLTLQVNLL